MHAMGSAADAASDSRSALLRKIPPVDELLALPALAGLAAGVSRELVVDAARKVLERVRDNISRGLAIEAPEPNAIASQMINEVARLLKPSLQGVINATGVILHTNLGRAPLGETAIAHIREPAGQYTNLDYDVAAGARAHRNVHTDAVLPAR